MIEHEQNLHTAGVDRIRNHQFLVMIVSAIIVSFFLVYVALSLYRSSGTMQLDLSRPGYDNARKEVTKDSGVFKAYPEDGPINNEALEQFDKLYKSKASEALIEIDAFSGDALSDEALSLN